MLAEHAFQALEVLLRRVHVVFPVARHLGEELVVAGAQERPAVGHGHVERGNAPDRFRRDAAVHEVGGEIGVWGGLYIHEALRGRGGAEVGEGGEVALDLAAVLLQAWAEAAEDVDDRGHPFRDDLLLRLGEGGLAGEDVVAAGIPHRFPQLGHEVFLHGARRADADVGTDDGEVAHRGHTGDGADGCTGDLAERYKPLQYAVRRLAARVVVEVLGSLGQLHGEQSARIQSHAQMRANGLHLLLELLLQVLGQFLVGRGGGRRAPGGIHVAEAVEGVASGEELDVLEAAAAETAQEGNGLRDDALTLGGECRELPAHLFAVVVGNGARQRAGAIHVLAEQRFQ